MTASDAPSQGNEAAPQFHSIDAAMERLSLSRAEIYRRVKEKLLKADKVDRRLRFSAEELQRYADVLAGERGALQEALTHWLASFAGRLSGRLQEELPPAAEKTVAEQTAELGRRILLDALSREAIDLYLDPLHQGDRLLLGEEGQRREIARFPAPLAGQLKTWIKALAPLAQVAESGIHEGLGKYQYDGNACQFRLAVVPTLLGEHLHLHFYLDSAQTSLASLGYAPPQAAALSSLLAGRPGLLLIVGPADAAADRHRLELARQLGGDGRLIVSLERRIQYRAEDLIQLGLQDEQKFAPLWRAALGMSPDVLLFDQVDSPAQARALLEGVGSGAVVVAQMHAATALDGLGQLFRLEIDRPGLTRVLLGVVERAALRRLCSACRAGRPLEPSEAEMLDTDPTTNISAARTCDQCGDGFSGRRYLCGLWPADDALTGWIRAADPQARPPAAPAELSLGYAARQAVLDGEVLLEEALPFLRS